MMTQYEQAKANNSVHTCANDIEVWPVQTSFGRLWTYHDGKMAYKDKTKAIAYAERLRP